jgi:hypothetical protein
MFFARSGWLLPACLAVLPGCGDEDDEVVAGDDGPVQLSVFAGCENEFHGTCDVLEAGCQERVFSTARCLRRQPDAVLPTVRVISEDELIGELMSGSEEVSEVSGEDAAADALTSERLVRASELLGLAEAGELSEESYVEVFVNTVPAYYSDQDHVVTLVDGASGDPATKTLTLLHELVHALQDQDQSLAALATDEGMSFDEYLAGLSIVEGEAEMLESFVSAASWGFDQDPNFRDFYTSWLPSAEAAFAGQSPLLVSPRYFPYSYGARFVFDVFASQGSAGVRALYDALPVSVLPMLLNETGRVSTLPESLLALPEPTAPAGFTRLEPDSFGPWVFGKFLERVVPELLGLDLPSQWRGDRVLVWSSDEQGIAALWTVRFESEAAASELFEPLRDRTLVGAPSASAFCVQSGRDVTLGVTEDASAREPWAAAVASTATAAGAASAAAPSGLPGAMPRAPAADSARAAERSASRDRARTFRTRLSRLARHLR